jgi:hypothetical protein
MSTERQVRDLPRIGVAEPSDWRIESAFKRSCDAYSVITVETVPHDFCTHT